ncbi:MAG: hypothetical protein GF329_21850 [Candidatus Lokiarchaeota archaeon]|nr:hypothetical protein [Candidatus Lokiarchaeota archaeon]
MSNEKTTKEKEIDSKNSVSINELNKIEDKEVFDLKEVYLIDVFDTQRGTSKYGNPYKKKDILVGVFEGNEKQIVSDEVRITTFDENMIKDFENIPKNKLINFREVKKNTFRNRINLLTTDDTKIEIVEKAKEKKEPVREEKSKPKTIERKEKEAEKPKQSKIEIKPKVKIFGNPRLEGLKIVQRGLQTVLSGIEILIKIEEEKEEEKED